MKILIAIALICTMLFLGCAGGQQSPAPQQNPGANPAGSQQASSAGQAPPAPPSNNPPSPPVQPASGSTGANPMDMLLAAFGKASGWKVTYEMTTNQPSTVTGTYQITQYAKIPDMFRTDFAIGSMKTQTYVLSKKVYNCGDAGAGWYCYELQSQEDASSTSYDLSSNMKSDPANYTVTADGTISIAGTTATCYKVVSADGTTTRYCVAPEGVPLYVKTTSTIQGKAYESELKATSYSTTVSDSDFALPATPQAMPGAGGSVGVNAGAGAGGSSGGDTCSYCSYLSGSQKDECLASCGSSG